MFKILNYTHTIHELGKSRETKYVIHVTFTYKGSVKILE